MRSHLAALLSLPLLAQATAPPAERREARSVGLGYHAAGALFTLMATGERLGFFTGAAATLPSVNSELSTERTPGPTTWSRTNGSRSEFHVGAAFRLDTRFVLGLGAIWDRQTYDYTLHPGTLFDYETRQNPGPLAETRSGVVAMADIRLGDTWGVHLLAGATGAGASLTWRF